MSIMRPTFYTTKLISKTMLNHDIMILVFERPEGFIFTAGQFVQFEVPQPNGPVLRSYSISSHPNEPQLEFCTKIIPGGKASEYFKTLAVGESAQITVAKGVFVCEQDVCTQKVFIATGVGIAPIMSMLAKQAESKDTLRLVFGVRNEQDIFWMDRLEKIKFKNKRFNYTVTLSQPTDTWAGERGWVSKHLPSFSGEVSYYICGSVEMVKDVRTLLLHSGVNTKNIHFEIF